MRVYFNYAAQWNPCLSFGKTGKYMVRELAHICDLVDDPKKADVQMYLGIPYYHQRTAYKRVCDTFLWFTMVEDPQVSAGAIKRINKADALLSPCQWCDEVYQKRGITIPRFIVPLGIDTEIYRYIERPRRENFTFLWVGVQAGHVNQLRDADRIGDRKRGWLVRQAFEELKLPNSRLILKHIPHPNPPIDITMGGVREIAKWLTEEEYIALIAEADCMVWPTWGEGFGLPPLEMGATGIPAIVPNYSGIADYFDPAWCIDLPYEVKRVWDTMHITGACIDIEALKDRMAWAYHNAATLREMGREGSKRIRRAWDWRDATRPALAHALSQYS